MANEGDTMTAYCQKCQQETTWTYLVYMLGKEIWQCMVCKGRLYK